MKENWEKNQKYSEQLGKSIVKSGFKPDLIIAIESSGVNIGKTIARMLSAKLITVNIKRPVSNTNLPKPVKEIIKLFQAPKINGIPIENLQNKKILVVDNSISSGKTINLALKYLMRKGAKKEEIRTASLYFLKRRILRKKPFKPDYFLTHRKSRLFRPKRPQIS